MNGASERSADVRPRSRWLALALIAAGVAVYAGSLSVPFLFDDVTWIARNEEIRSLGEPGALLGGTSRPVLKLSLALDYAVHGLSLRGYHLVNLAVHLLAGLTLFGLVRRTLRGPRFGDRLSARADGLAFAVALLWLVHPLGTQAVTYIVQRGESLMGLFYLLTLYGVARCGEGERAGLFGTIAVAACALGMGTKEVMVTAPVAALLYDRTFLSDSVCASLRARWPLHLALAGTWGVMLFGIGVDTLLAGEFARSTLPTITPAAYAATQPAVILHYLRLALWPHPLCFDYGWQASRGAAEILPPLIAIAGLAAAAGVLLWKRSWIGFAGALFFLVLLPTSSIVPIADLAVEHRMYLPLAALAALGVGAGHWLAERAGRRGRAAAAVLFGVCALALAAATVARNREYQSDVTLWESVTRAAPQNPRGHYNLGTSLRAAGRDRDAISALRRAVAIDPGHARAHYNLANALKSLDRPDDAITHFRLAVAADPSHDLARMNLANTLTDRGDPAAAIAIYRSVLRSRGGDANAHYNLGAALEAQGDADGAAASYRRALDLAPGHASAHYNLGRILAGRGDLDRAEHHLRRSLAVRPDHARAHHHLAVVLLAGGDREDALAHERRALDLDPDYEPARQALERADAGEPR